MTGSYTAMLVARPARRSPGILVVDGTLVVMPMLWAVVDLLLSVVARGVGRTPAAALA
jgi:hypothetical protein